MLIVDTLHIVDVLYLSVSYDRKGQCNPTLDVDISEARYAKAMRIGALSVAHGKTAVDGNGW